MSEQAVIETTPAAAPAENVVQQSVPMEMQGQMQERLASALNKLSAKEMPVEGRSNRRQSTAESSRKQQVVAEPLAAPAPQKEVIDQPVTSSEPVTPPQPQQQMWGPAHQKALQEVLQSNQSMEQELKGLRDSEARYRAMVEAAQAGDIMGFADQAKLSEKDILDAMANGGRAGVTKPYVKKLEGTVEALSSKLAALEQQISQREFQAKNERELGEITQQLNVKPEYGILKKIPDAALRVQGLIRQHHENARNRGEVAPAFTVEQAATMLKGQIVQALKQMIDDDAVKQELGLMGDVVAAPDIVKPRPTKAITGKMSSQGSQTPKSTGYNQDEQLKRALRKMIT